MWIETENNQLVNTANVDTIFISNINEQYFLIAQKNFSDFQVAEYVLAEGSRQRIETQYKRVAEAIQSKFHYVLVRSRKQIKNPNGNILERAAEAAQPSGYDPQHPKEDDLGWDGFDPPC